MTGARRVLALGFAGILLLQLAGCGAPSEPAEVRVDPRVQLRPSETYRLVLWEERLPPSLDGVESEEWLARVLERFRDQYPNVEVAVEYVTRDEATGRLRRAVDEGRPPDVYGLWDVNEGLEELPLQVPARLYGDPDAEIAGSWPAVAWALVGGDAAAVWPRWIAPRVWIAGPSWPLGPEVPEYGAVASSLAGTSRLALVNPGAALEQLAGAAASIATEAPDPRLLEWLARLTASRRLSVDDGLEDMAQARVGLIGGLTPWGTAVALARLPSSKPVAVPVPRGSSGAWTLDMGAVAVFRQEPYRGHEHARAAVELARALSAAGTSWTSERSLIWGLDQVPAVAAAPGWPSPQAVLALATIPRRWSDEARQRRGAALMELAQGRSGIGELEAAWRVP